MQHNSQIVLFQSPPEPCSYLQHHIARNVYADPFRAPTMDLYNLLIQKGFRRSGHHIYRPNCDGCAKCVSMRIPVGSFRPNRSQRRARKSNNDLTIHVEDSRYSDEYFELYKRYLDFRHKNAGMDNPERADFERFLICDWCDTVFCELRLDGQLIAVAVTDKVSSGLSAVYTFFDPAFPQRSLGTVAIMIQIELAARLKAPFVYLGYWIDGCGKMKYKANFSPQERFINERWAPFGK
jgi:arginine-tRNA-protein transferase